MSYENVPDAKAEKELSPKTKRMIELLHRKAPVRPGKLRRQAEHALRAELAAKNLLKKLQARAARASTPAKDWDPEVKSPAHVINNANWKTGDKVKFARSETAYEKKLAGNLVRIHPVKPYRNRAEQKQYNKARRKMREGDRRAAAQNEEGLYGSYDDAA